MKSYERYNYFLVSLVFIFLQFSCEKNEHLVWDGDTSVYLPLMEVPEGFPDISIPSDNAFSEDRWLLGKKLFFDPILSRDSTVSCSSCHKQELAFGDDTMLSFGIEKRLSARNSPPLFNLAYHPYFLKEGAVATIEQQILVPIQEHAEMDFNIVYVADRMNNNPNYVELSQKAYGRAPEPFVITRAIANFERSLISGNSRYDKYINGDNSLLSSQELDGKDLFFSERLACSKCHGGFNFTNYAFKNNGLYLNYIDEGRARLTGNQEDLALFKTPSLRNVELSAPYMHDGSLETLEDVLEHYNQGGKNHVNKSTLIKPLNLTSKEKSALKSFLITLTDHTFISNPNFKN